MQWKKKSAKVPQNSDELRQIVFENRAINESDVHEFLNPTFPTELDLKEIGFNVTQFQNAVIYILKAIQEDKKIVIFGDYDVDGICASAILWQVLFKLYRTTHPKGINHPVPFIPHREKHGYGITKGALDEIIEAHGPQLIVTVDNGIVAHEPILYAKEKGIAVILTDHHQPETKNKKQIFPKADFVLHTTQLCGATVAWVLAHALDKNLAEKLLDLAGIATIADQVPLLGANRSFAKYGIIAVQKSKNIGLVALCQSAGINQSEATEGTIGFAIAPRINAIGRLEHGLDALRLLCTQNKKQATDLAQLLTQTNISRQDLTKQMLDDAKLQVTEFADEHICIVFSNQFHEGILGLIAGGLVEEFQKPAIAISIGPDLAKASARSVFGVNIVELLREIQEDLVSVGGHPLAAGFSFLPKNFSMIRDKLFNLARKRITQEQLEKSLSIDCEVPVSLISIKTIESLSEFAPFGMKNPQPVLEVQNLRILEVKSIGKEQEHIKLKVIDAVSSDGAISFDCLGWRMGNLMNELKVADTIAIAGTVDINEWRDKKYPQVVLKDIQKL
ncbi:single-stranded-DNA-specific exonuclease RecJ [Candidatus Woesebacteria bacterium]|nr:single-stranded-DNA-specific exonuclease RecJ [Candidatus Woesebacteria bacterium]